MSHESSSHKLRLFRRYNFQYPKTYGGYADYVRSIVNSNMFHLNLTLPIRLVHTNRSKAFPFRFAPMSISLSVFPNEEAACITEALSFYKFLDQSWRTRISSITPCVASVQLLSPRRHRIGPGSRVGIAGICGLGHLGM